jgi:hypothetical protein
MRTEPAGCSPEETLMLVDALLADGALGRQDGSQSVNGMNPSSPSQNER